MVLPILSNAIIPWKQENTGDRRKANIFLSRRFVFVRLFVQCLFGKVFPVVLISNAVLTFLTYSFSYVSSRFSFFLSGLDRHKTPCAGWRGEKKRGIERERRKSSRIEIGRGLKQRFRCVYEKGREEGAHIDARFFFFFFFFSFVALSKERD